jgi:5-histidylcysteine sulfoxide synthase
MSQNKQDVMSPLTLVEIERPVPVPSLPQVRLAAGREAMLRYFENTWQLTELLFSGLAGKESFYRRPYHQLRHPMIFYYGHPVALYVNKLRVAGVLDSAVNAECERLFETGVDEMRWDDLYDGRQDIWPEVAAVSQYRQQVYALLHRLIETHPLPDQPINQQSPLWALVMGFEHERIHLETSSVLMRELPIECVRRPEAWPALGARTPGRRAPENRMVAVEACTVQVGKPNDFPSFGWDNEYGGEERAVGAFSASRQLISNGEYLEFIRAGGYSNPGYWSTQGWAWRSFRNSKWPSFWAPKGPAGLHEYSLRTIFEVIDLPLDWPACVNYHEAKAYCAWKTQAEKSPRPYRLPSEAEHIALRDDRPVSGNLHLALGSECPVDAFAENTKGFCDVFGNVWQWCEDPFHPLADFAVHPFYEDFSLPCFDGEHQMIMGGSFISTGDMADRWARFHFRPHFFQHCGFRIARSDSDAPVPVRTVLR